MVYYPGFIHQVTTTVIPASRGDLSGVISVLLTRSNYYSTNTSSTTYYNSSALNNATQSGTSLTKLESIIQLSNKVSYSQILSYVAFL